MSQNRPGVMYCPDVIETTVCLCGRNGSLRYMATPSVMTVGLSERGAVASVRLKLQIKGERQQVWREPNKMASDLSGFMVKP